MATGGRIELLEVGSRLLDALSQRDYDEVAACFSGDAKLRALVPSTVREDDGPEAIQARYRFWWDGLDDFRLTETQAEPLADAVRIAYRVEAIDEGEPIVQEQVGYALVENGRITRLNLVCSGARPRT
jgi:hypothetical protein